MKQTTLRGLVVLALLSLTFVLAAQVNVTGQVVANDVPDGAEGALVSLVTGGVSTSVLTNETGNFLFEEVTANNYNLLVSYNGYGLYDSTITVTNEPLDVGIITVTEFIWNPRNVVAEEVGDNINVTWEEPVAEFDDEQWLSHSTYNRVAGFGSNSGNIDWGSAHRFTHTQLSNLGVHGLYVTAIDFNLNAYNANVNYTVNVFRGGSYDGTNFDEGELVYSQVATGLSTGWNEIVLDEPVRILPHQELWFGYHIQCNLGYAFHPFATDNSNTAPATGDLFYYNDQWNLMSMFSFLEGRNFNIRAYAGAYQGDRSVSFATNPVDYRNNNLNVTLAAPEDGPRIADTRIERTDDRTSRPDFNYRILERYNVYRFTSGNENNPDQWTFLGTTEEETTFTDEGWLELPDQHYKYAVKAVYTGDVESDPATSNSVERVRFYTYDVTGRVIGSDAPDGIEGANVYLVSNEHTFSTTTTADGSFLVEDVIGSAMGVSYNAFITANNYTTHSSTITVTEQPVNMGTLTINEVAWAASNVVAEANFDEVQVEVTWEAPNPGEYGPGEEWIYHGTGSFNNYFRPGAPFDMIFAHRFSPEQLADLDAVGLSVKTVSFYSGDTWSTNYVVHVYRGGSASPYDPGELVYEQLVTQARTRGWNDVVLDEPVPILPGQEMWFGVRAHGTSSGMDVMGTEPAPPTDGYGNMFYNVDTGYWQTLWEAYSHRNNNVLVRALVGYPHQGDYRQLSLDGNDRSRNRGDIRDSFTPMPYRALEGFNVYRFNVLHEENPAQWVLIATVDAEVTSFIDRTWDGVNEDDDYKYAVQAFYTGDVLADFAISNVIEAPLFYGGLGTQDDPYRIERAQDLEEILSFTHDSNTYFKQTADIRLGVEPYNHGNWYGTLNGHYDGNGHTIDGLFVNRPGGSYAGLFSQTGSNASIRNVTLTNVEVIGAGYVGALVGRTSYTNISNCAVLSGTVTGNGAEVGGITGHLRYRTLENSYNNATVTSSGNSVGGIAGYNYEGNIVNSFNMGSVSGNSLVGGIAGTSRRGNINYNYNAAQVTANTTSVGGVLGGTSFGVTELSTYWDTEASGQLGSAGNFEGRTTEQMTYPYEDSYAGWNFNTIWGHDPTFYFNDGYPFLQWLHEMVVSGISITGDDQITINIVENITKPYTIDVLNQGGGPMPNETSTSYIEDVEGTNVAAEHITFNNGTLTVTTAANNGVVRINAASNTDPGITTTFDVTLSYPVASEIIVSGEERIEVNPEEVITQQYAIEVFDQFADMFPGAPVFWSVQDVEGDNAAQERISIDQAGLLSVNTNAEDGYVNVVVTSGTDEEVYGTLTVWITIPFIVSDVAIDGTEMAYIPLVDVQEDQYTATVMSQYNDPMPEEDVIWSIEDVDGTNVTDGYITLLDGLLTITTTATDGIVNVIATSVTNPEISDTLPVHVLAAEITSVAIDGPIGVDIPWSDTATGEYTANVLDQIDRVMPGELVTWSIYDTERDNVAEGFVTIDTETGVLTVQSISRDGQIVVRATSITNDTVYGEYDVAIRGEFWDGTGTINDPFQIKYPHHLSNLRGYTGSWSSDYFFEQIADIDLDVAPYNTPWAYWTPIGTGTSSGFGGNFDGKGYEIQNMIVRTGNFAGLFGSLYGATVRNVHLVNVDVEGGSNVGGLAGYARYQTVTISNCSVTGRVYGSGQEVGGLVGFAYQYVNINSSFVDADVSNSWGYTIGGLVGRAGNSTTVHHNNIVNCYTRGTVSSQGNADDTYNMGGLIGLRYGGTVVNCYTTARVNHGLSSSGDRTHAAIGDNNGASITNTYWDIQATGHVQGWRSGTNHIAAGRTTEQMTYPYDENTYVNWLFGLESWRVDSTTPPINNGYPIFAWQMQPAEISVVEVTGLEEIEAPVGDPFTTTYNAVVRDQYGEPYPEETVSWSVEDEDGNNVDLGHVTINQEGELTVAITALDGVVNVVATSHTNTDVFGVLAVTIIAPDPVAPVVNIEIVNNQVVLSWENVYRANSYTIYASSDPYDEQGWNEIANIAAAVGDETTFSKPIEHNNRFYRVTSSSAVVEGDQIIGLSPRSGRATETSTGRTNQ